MKQTYTCAWCGRTVQHAGNRPVPKSCIDCTPYEAFAGAFSARDLADERLASGWIIDPDGKQGRAAGAVIA